MTRIKVCGLTREADVRLARDLGVDAIGLVFWPRSPRAVSVERAARLAREAGPFVTVVGVFVDEEPDRVAQVAREVGLGAVQLHGSEPVAQWTTFPGGALKAVAVTDAWDPMSLSGWPARVVPVLDVHDPERRGGTGRRVDWDVAARAAALRPVVLAGGLTPDNVGEAIRRVAPAGVDVSSGIEDAPGVKNAEAMRRFVEAVRRMDESRR